MANNRIPRVPVREQDPQVRAANFEEVCHGYDRQEALLDEEVEFALPDAALPAAPAETPADDGAAVGLGTPDAPAVESPAQTDKKQ